MKAMKCSVLTIDNGNWKILIYLIANIANETYSKDVAI